MTKDHIVSVKMSGWGIFCDLNLSFHVCLLISTHVGELMLRTRDRDFLLPAASTKLLLQVRSHEPKPAPVQRAKKNQTRPGLVKTLSVICLASFVLTKAQIVLVK